MTVTGIMIENNRLRNTLKTLRTLANEVDGITYQAALYEAIDVIRERIMDNAPYESIGRRILYNN